MHAQHLLQRIADGAERCRSASLTGPVDRDVCRTVMESLQNYMQARPSTHIATEVYAQILLCRPAVLQTGLKGNRAVDPEPLSVVSAMTRAYPLLLGSCWTHASHAQQGLTDSIDAVLWSWLAQASINTLMPSMATLLVVRQLLQWQSKMSVVQASVDGSLVTLCSRLSSQPQIASAYAKQAPMRITQPADLKAALLPLQVNPTACKHVTTPHIRCYCAER